MSNALGINPYGELNNNHDNQKDLYRRYNENQQLELGRQRRLETNHKWLLSMLLFVSLVVRRAAAFFSHAGDLS